MRRAIRIDVQRAWLAFTAAIAAVAFDLVTAGNWAYIVSSCSASWRFGVIFASVIVDV
jgi:hypothetical protein